MNSALPEMLHCLHTPENFAGNGVELTLPERQRARLRYLNQTQYGVFSVSPQETQPQQCQALINTGPTIRELANRSMKADPGLENGWPGFGNYSIPNTEFATEMTRFPSSGFAMDHSISRTSSCPPTVATVEEKGRESVVTEKMASTVGRENFKKRKADKTQNQKNDCESSKNFVWESKKLRFLKVDLAEEDRRDKRIKGDAQEVESKVTEQNNNREISTDTSKTSEVQKPDYIHVRARRGQATDSHSLAERVRREKISERMKHLQDLVPGCNKITGKAGMLDEIINYVQSLQRQVEFLSMKLAAVNPRLDHNVDNFFTKEAFPACTSSFLPIGMSSEMVNPAFLQLNPVEQVVSCCGLDMAMNPLDVGLGRTTSCPVSIPDAFLDTSCFAQAQPSSSWETDLPSLFNLDFLHQGRSTAFPSQQPFAGNLEANNLKMEL